MHTDTSRGLLAVILLGCLSLILLVLYTYHLYSTCSIISYIINGG